MRINSVSALWSINSFKSSHVQSAVKSNLAPLDSDCFELSIKEKPKTAEQILDNYRKFDIESYKSLTTQEIDILDKASDEDIKYAAKLSVDIGVPFQKYWDDLFGKDNWVYVSIGTSTSGLARVFEFSGIETKYLPISDMKKVDGFTDFSEYEHLLPNYGKFLEEQGLTNEQIEQTGKTYLFADYVYTGRTIDLFKKLMIKKFGIKNEKVLYPTINAHLEVAIPTSNRELVPYRREYVRKYMQYAEMEQYGGVPHLPMDSIDKINQCKYYSSNNAKLFNFEVIRYLDEKGLLKQNPKNSNSL